MYDDALGFVAIYMLGVPYHGVVWENEDGEQTTELLMEVYEDGSVHPISTDECICAAETTEDCVCGGMHNKGVIQ